MAAYQKPPAHRLSPEERRRRIREPMLEGRVGISELAKEMGVSEITIRRDLVALENAGKLLRVRGGAVSNDRMAYEFSFRDKEARNHREKAAIGRAAARLVKAGQAVFVDTGTTSLAAARCLRATKPGVIVTINLCVAAEYVGQSDVRVLVPGGELGRHSPDLYGEWTLDKLSKVSVDIALLGCDSVDPTEGFFCADTRSAAVSRLMLERSQSAYLLADHTKFGGRAFCHIAALKHLTGIITDSMLPSTTLRKLRKLGINMIVAKTGKEPS